MDIKVIDELTGKEVGVQEEAPKEPKEPTEDTFVPGEHLVKSVADLFDLKPSEIGKYDTKIHTLIAYAKSKTKDHSPEGIKWAIRSLSHTLNTPPTGEKMIAYLTRFAHLAIEKQKLEKEMKNYGGDTD